MTVTYDSGPFQSYFEPSRHRPGDSFSIKPVLWLYVEALAKRKKTGSKFTHSRDEVEDALQRDSSERTLSVELDARSH